MKTFKQFQEEISATRKGRALGNMGTPDKPQATKAMSSGGSGQRGGMTMTPVTSMGRQKSTKNNPDADDMRNAMYNKIKQDEKRGKTKEDRVKQVKQNKAKKAMGLMKIIKK